MSYECRYAFCSAVWLRATASPIVRPSTNCSAISFIACRIATRTTGSPARATKRSYHARGSRASSRSMRVSLPVSIRPHVEALTSSESDSPRWRSQSPRESLSRMSASAVAASGMRSKRFGDAHQQHALGRRKVVLLQERLDAALRLPLGAHGLDPRARLRRRSRAPLLRPASTCAASATSVVRSSARNASRIAAPSGASGSSGSRLIGHVVRQRFIPADGALRASCFSRSRATCV